jgi:iron complex transport system substrate-binding protein
MNSKYAVAMLVLAAFASTAAAAPVRIVSLNLCADEMVLRLAVPGTVKSVTWLARDPALSKLRGWRKPCPSTEGWPKTSYPSPPI